MLALDQRGSLRSIIAQGRPESEIGDEVLVAFKAAAVDILAPEASAVLLDAGLGRKAMGLLPPDVPLILAADHLVQQPGGPVETTFLDPEVTPDLIAACRPVALKLLVIWKRGVEVEYRRDLVGRFLELARATGCIALVEGIARTETGGRFANAQDFGEAVLEAAGELSGLGGDVYKAEVPGYAPGQLDLVGGFAKRLTAMLDQPWVVLSNGVASEDFAAAVRLCCQNGASGFLAGRAIWTTAATGSDLRGDLRSQSLPRLRDLAAIVHSSRAG